MKGFFSKMRIVYGVVTVSDKGQIAIPVDLRSDLGLEKGDKLMVLKRKEEAGLPILKLDKMDDLMNKPPEDKDFFKKKMTIIPKCKDCKHFKP